MRGAFAGAILTVLLCCAPAFALDPISVPGVGTASCAQTDYQDPPNEVITDSCEVDTAAATASCTRVQSTVAPSTGDCKVAADGTTLDCTRYETFLYVSNDNVACAASTASGDGATCESDHTNDFFVTGDSSRTTGCTLADGTSCYVTTQPDTDPDDPAFPVPDGTDPAITPRSGCPAP
jgi:hypothetical protein